MMYIPAYVTNGVTYFIVSLSLDVCKSTIGKNI